MIVVILGASGSGKSTLEKELCTYNGYQKIVSYTTRQPRDGEENGKDYYFINNETFNEMYENGLFAEYDEYTHGRKYGTLKSDYMDGENRVVVLTPNGLRQLKKNIDTKDDIFTVLVNANLGTRIKRYIDRCGVDNFDYKDKDEISDRVERDYGMFLGVDKEVDCVLNNNEGTNIKDLVSDILSF